MSHGGDEVAEVLATAGVQHLFTLVGGHISPILVGAKQRGIRVVDTRHEATAVFAADAVARLTGSVGVAAVTAGPGLTNTLTALKNAQMAMSPVVVLGGATATMLKGRGSLQDIDQISVVEPHVKRAFQVQRVREIRPTLAEAIRVARSGAPGPVFVELPVDLLYPEETVREWYLKKTGGESLGARALTAFLRHHVDDMFRSSNHGVAGLVGPVPSASEGQIRAAAQRLAAAERPLMIVGSQALQGTLAPPAVARAVEELGVPVYLSGMARGLLGADHPLQSRHKRRVALKEADVVVLAGVPCDFRLDYGDHIRRGTELIAIGRRSADLYLNKVPTLAVRADVGTTLAAIAEAMVPGDWSGWSSSLAGRDAEREAEIDEQAGIVSPPINPLVVCRELEAALGDRSLLVADGGDFVATASYVVRPRGPLTWLDPGPFGTLGVGAGFALGAKLARPEADVWILWGDGSAGYGLVEMDTFARHGVGVTAVIGNDGGWTQIARDQVPLLGDDVACVLERSAYHQIAQTFGGEGIEVRRASELAAAYARGVRAARAGRPAVVNVHMGTSDFRSGSLSM